MTPKSNRLEDRILRYTLVSPGNMFDVCFKIIRSYGLGVAMSGKRVSDYENVDISLADPLNINQHFKNGTKVTLSTLEALSMAYVTAYYEHHSAPGFQHFIGVDIEDKRDNLTERELYLSDGVLAINKDSHSDTITPFQQVIAQNIVGNKSKVKIQAEIIERINAKVKRRATYNDISGLIVSILPGDDQIDIGIILESCDMEAFLPTFLVQYWGNLESCTVYHLDNSIRSLEDLKGRAYTITPKLAYKQ